MFYLWLLWLIFINLILSFTWLCLFELRDQSVRHEIRFVHHLDLLFCQSFALWSWERFPHFYIITLFILFSFLNRFLHLLHSGRHRFLYLWIVLLWCNFRFLLSLDVWKYIWIRPNALLRLSFFIKLQLSLSSSLANFLYFFTIRRLLLRLLFLLSLRFVKHNDAGLLLFVFLLLLCIHLVKSNLRS